MGCVYGCDFYSQGQFTKIVQFRNTQQVFIMKQPSYCLSSLALCVAEPLDCLLNNIENRIDEIPGFSVLSVR